MDPTDLLINLLAKTSPALVAVIAVSAGLVKGAVHLARARYPRLAGNVVQTLAAGASLVVVAGEALSTGAFQHFSVRHDLVAYLLASAVVWLVSIGIHEVATDQGGSKPLFADPREGTP